MNTEKINKKAILWIDDKIFGIVRYGVFNEVFSFEVAIPITVISIRVRNYHDESSVFNYISRASKLELHKIKRPLDHYNPDNLIAEFNDATFKGSVELIKEEYYDTIFLFHREEYT